MSFISDLKNQDNEKVPQVVWMPQVNCMVIAVENTVKSEFKKGNHHFVGYFTWLDNDVYLNEKNSPLTIGGTIPRSDYPLEDMSSALNDRIGPMGFSAFRVYFDNVTRYKYSHKNYFSVKEKLVPVRQEKAIWIDLCW